MKGKRSKLIATSIILVVILVIAGAIIYAKSNTVITNQNGAKVDLDIAKNKEVLKTDSKSLSSNKKQVILDIAWGDAEEQLKMSVYNGETSTQYETPASFAMGNDGSIYVYDTLNKKIKMFKNNIYQKSIPITVKPHTAFALHDIAVDSDGNIYGVSRFTDEAIKVDSKGNEQPIFKMQGNDALKRPEWIDVLPSGNILLQDNFDPENATRVRKFDKDGNAISKKELSNMIDYTLFDFENKNGDIISAGPISARSYQFELKDKTSGERKAICNYAIESPSKEIYRGASLLGADNNGLVYFKVEEMPDTSQVDLRQSVLYIDRLDIVKNKVDTIKIDGLNWDMSNSYANVCNRLIKIDNEGNIYQVLLSMQGYKIIKYSF